jgi:hypothetical protein
VMIQLESKNKGNGRIPIGHFLQKQPKSHLPNRNKEVIIVLIN